MSTVPTKAKLDDYVKMGLLKCQRHHDLPLTIYNYTEITNFERLWNNVTLQARGLVVDDNDICIVRCLQKFFNHDEPLPYCHPSHGSSDSDIEHYDKRDGSLIQIVNNKDYGLIITSKASFNSDQSMWAKEIVLDNNYEFLDEYTYIFELIHPENRIVLDYQGDKRLDLLAIINTSTGNEENIYGVKYSQFNKVNKIEIEDVRQHLNSKSVEGLVIKYPNGKRVKMKTEEYIKLHRIMTDFTEKRIWEMLSSGENIDITNMPEEFENWYNDTRDYFLSGYKNIESVATEIKNRTDSMSDKEIGLDNSIEYKNIVFLMRKNKDYNMSIWKMLKPSNQ